jgi:hypothetical protein
MFSFSDLVVAVALLSEDCLVHSGQVNVAVGILCLFVCMFLVVLTCVSMPLTVSCLRFCVVVKGLCRNDGWLSVSF